LYLVIKKLVKASKSAFWAWDTVTPFAGDDGVDAVHNVPGSVLSSFSPLIKKNNLFLIR